jgi:hypothetical protein
MGEPVVWSSLEGERPKGMWLWGRAVDSLLAGGLASLLFGLVAIVGTFASPLFAPVLVTGFLHAGIGVNYPHYAATYQLVYRERKRAPRSFVLLLASLPFLIGLVVLGALEDRSFGWIVRLYLTWSPFHYAKQHFGIASMYAARAGAPLVDREKKLLVTAFVAAAGFTILALNASTLNPSLSVGETLRLPALLPASVYPLALVSAFVSLVAAGLAYVAFRKRTGQAWTPMVTLLLTVNVAWLVLPNLWVPGGAPGPWVGGGVALWLPFAIPFFHCAQYLTVAAHRSRQTGPVRPIVLLVALMLFGYAIFELHAKAVEHVAHVTEARALLLVTALVNVHHFWLDGIVWRAPNRAKSAAS